MTSLDCDFVIKLHYKSVAKCAAWYSHTMQLMQKMMLAFVVAIMLSGCSGLKTSERSSDLELNYPDAIDLVRRSEWGWMDIPYHFVIDLEGSVYEGRPLQYPGATNTTYDPTTHALIVVVGNYEVRDVTEPQLKSLANLTAFLATEYSVDLPDIRGHKDYAPGETDCPGANIYQTLEDGSLLRRVEQIHRANSITRPLDQEAP